MCEYTNNGTKLAQECVCVCGGGRRRCNNMKWMSHLTTFVSNLNVGLFDIGAPAPALPWEVTMPRCSPRSTAYTVEPVGTDHMLTYSSSIVLPI